MKLADFATPSFQADPYPFYEILRAEGPLVPIAPNSMISGHYDVVDKVLHDRHMIHNFEGWVRKRYGDDGLNQPVLRGLGRMFLLINPPEHIRLRSLMMNAFNARQIESMRDIANSSAQSLIDRFEARGSVDLVSAYAKPFPIEIICRMLDVPIEHAEKLSEAMDHLATMLDATPADTAQLAASNDAYETLERHFTKVVEAPAKTAGNRSDIDAYRDRRRRSNAHA